MPSYLETAETRQTDGVYTVYIYNTAGDMLMNLLKTIQLCAIYTASSATWNSQQGISLERSTLWPITYIYNTLASCRCMSSAYKSCVKWGVEQASARVTPIAKGLWWEEAAMIISTRKSKVMDIHKKTRVSATTEADVASLNSPHKCSECAREFTKQRGLRIHMAR